MLFVFQYKNIRDSMKIQITIGTNIVKFSLGKIYFRNNQYFIANLDTSIYCSN